MESATDPNRNVWLVHVKSVTEMYTLKCILLNYDGKIAYHMNTIPTTMVCCSLSLVVLLAVLTSFVCILSEYNIHTVIVMMQCLVPLYDILE